MESVGGELEGFIDVASHVRGDKRKVVERFEISRIVRKHRAIVFLRFFGAVHLHQRAGQDRQWFDAVGGRAPRLSVGWR